jgi:hypothetical protein
MEKGLIEINKIRCAKFLPLKLYVLRWKHGWWNLYSAACDLVDWVREYRYSGRQKAFQLDGRRNLDFSAYRALVELYQDVDDCLDVEEGRFDFKASIPMERRLELADFAGKLPLPVKKP